MALPLPCQGAAGVRVRFTADSVADKTVGEVRAQVEQLLNVPASAQARVNGAPADEATVIANGSTIEFVKSAGEKGCQR